MSNFNPSFTTINKRQSFALHLCIWAGVISPFLFVFVFSLDGFLKPEYLTQPISYLELGAIGWLQRANFIVLGLFLILFAFGLSLEDGTTDKASAIACQYRFALAGRFGVCQ